MQNGGGRAPCDRWRRCRAGAVRAGRCRRYRRPSTWCPTHSIRGGPRQYRCRAARRSGVEVAYVPDYCAEEVADHTAAPTLSLLRRLPQLDRDVRDGGWNVVAIARDVRPARNTTVGFFGLGRIGRGTLERLRPFGFQFVVADPAVGLEEAVGLGVTLVDRGTLLATANAILLHLPLAPATRHIVDADALSRQGVRR